MKKIAVILYNLGGPDSKTAIKPFLFNFFMDKNIIGAPLPIRFLLAKYISIKRSKREAGESYKELGNQSPLLENTQKQAQALENTLNENTNNEKYKVFICMRYWHPMAPQVIQDVKNWHADKIIQLPLYPQFSTTTTWSSLENWKKAAKDNYSTATICCYPENTGFINASADNIAKEHRKAITEGYKNPRILFSAHGLPEKIIKAGDPYQYQCERTAEKIAQKLSEDLKIKNLDWQICYQSRVGPLRWIGPSVEEALQKAAQDQKAVIIYPHAFTQEHVETLVELDIEYRHLAEKNGISGYYRAQTAGIEKAFIDGLAKLVQSRLNQTGIQAEGGKCFCPKQFNRCCMHQTKAVIEAG